MVEDAAKKRAPEPGTFIREDGVGYSRYGCARSKSAKY